MEPEITLDDAYAEPEAEVVEESAETGADEVEAKSETEEVEKTETGDSPPEPKEKEPWTLTAVLDEREKRQKLAKENEELRKQLESQQPKEDDISIFDDETGAKEQITERITQTVRENLLAQSEAFAVMQLGEEKVKAAADWAAKEAPTNPTLLKAIQESQLPYHKAVELYETAQKWAEMSDEDAYEAKIRAKVLKELQAEGQATEANLTQKQEAITPSLASQRSAATDKGTAEDFSDMLNP
jgi:hypothetical protein